MKHIKRIVTMVLALALVLCMVPVTAEAATVKLSSKKMTLYVGSYSYGEYISDDCYLQLANAKSGIKWSTSNKKVAVVHKYFDNVIIIEPKKAGTANITATYKNKKYTCKVTVKEPGLKKKSGTPSTIEVLEGSYVYLADYITVSKKVPAGAVVNVAKNKSSDKKVMSYDGYCSMIANKQGTAKVTITLNKAKVTLNFRVVGKSELVSTDIISRYTTPTWYDEDEDEYYGGDEIITYKYTNISNQTLRLNGYNVPAGGCLYSRDDLEYLSIETTIAEGVKCYSDSSSAGISVNISSTEDTTYAELVNTSGTDQTFACLYIAKDKDGTVYDVGDVSVAIQAGKSYKTSVYDAPDYTIEFYNFAVSAYDSEMDYSRWEEDDWYDDDDWY